MDETIKKSWDNWAAEALKDHVDKIMIECLCIEEHIHLFPNGRDKVKINDLVHEIENRTIWIRQLAMRQMLEDLKKEI